MSDPTPSEAKSSANPMSEKQTSSERFEEQDKLINKLCIDLQSRDQSIKQLQSLLAQRDAEIAELHKEITRAYQRITKTESELTALRSQLAKAEKVIDKARFAILREHGEIRQRQERREFLETVQSYDSSAALNQDKTKGEG